MVTCTAWIARANCGVSNWPPAGKSGRPTPRQPTEVRTDNATAFLVKQADRYFIFNEFGQLVIARLSPDGYQELSRAKILEPAGTSQRRSIVWSHPAYAQRCIFARNDREVVCVSLAAAQ